MNVKEFEDISTNIFAPIYPVIAKQILEKGKVPSNGKCLDLGSGNGHLGIALAKASELEVCLYDINQDMLNLAENRINDTGLKDQVSTLLGDACDLPFADQSMDLIISRGSMFFWENRVNAFKEIFRVLKPGGYTYIGGGFGSQKIKDEIDKKMLKRDANWCENAKKRRGSKKPYEMEIIEAGIKDYEIIDDESGLWLVFHKAASIPKVLSVFPSCAVKVGMRELFKLYVEEYNEKNEEKLIFNLLENLDTRSDRDLLSKVQNVDSYPDIIVECGYGLLQERNFKKFLKLGLYTGFENNEKMTLLGLGASIIVVDHTKLDGLKIPTSFIELLSPIYKDKIVIHGHGINSCDMGIIMYLEKLYSKETALAFADQIHELKHFTQVARHIGKGFEDASPINVMPDSIVSMIPNKENVSFIWPKEGTPGFPMFAAVKTSEKDNLQEVIDFMLSSEFENYLRGAHFLPEKHSFIENEYGSPVDFLGWDRVLSDSFKEKYELLEMKVLSIIKSNMDEEKLQGLRGNKVVC